jgi:hypothetical protein
VDSVKTTIAENRRQQSPGLILAIANAAGIEVSGDRRKRPIRCPLHADTQPSAFLEVEKNFFYCSVCTPDGGWGARRFAEALGVPWAADGSASVSATRPPSPVAAESRFSPADAERTWDLALGRARDDHWHEADMPVYSYLGSRSLVESWEVAAFGIAASGTPLPAAVAGWPRTGHQIVVPLYDDHGQLTNIQGRAIRPAAKKVLFPIGSRAAGTLFASRSGLQVLRSTWTGERTLILGEGLTDFLALSITTSLPLLCAPGVGIASKAIGSWVAGFTVLLALDCDSAGEGAIAAVSRAIYAHGGTRVRRLEWAPGIKDVCDLLRAHGAVRVISAIEAVRHG